MAWVKVADLAQLPIDQGYGVLAQGVNLVLARAGDTVYAGEDRCTHESVPLQGGSSEGSEIECQRHGARFDLATGKALSLPAIRPLKTFSAKVEDGAVYVDLP